MARFRVRPSRVRTTAVGETKQRDKEIESMKGGKEGGGRGGWRRVHRIHRKKKGRKDGGGRRREGGRTKETASRRFPGNAVAGRREGGGRKHVAPYDDSAGGMAATCGLAPASLD